MLWAAPNPTLAVYHDELRQGIRSIIITAGWISAIGRHLKGRYSQRSEKSCPASCAPLADNLDRCKLLVMLLLSMTILLASSQPVTTYGQACPSRPADILNEQEMWQGVTSYAELPQKNKIIVNRVGSILWNGQGVSAKQLNTLLRTVSKLDPQPLTQFEWKIGAPCQSIGLVRKIMLKNLKCLSSRKCLEGPDSHWPKPRARL